jgi:hypothetical protein
MEIANSPVPVAGVSYKKFIFLTVTQLTEGTRVKITVLWYRLCLLQLNFVTVGGSKSLSMIKMLLSQTSTLL